MRGGNGCRHALFSTGGFGHKNFSLINTTSSGSKPLIVSPRSASIRLVSFHSGFRSGSMLGSNHPFASSSKFACSPQSTPYLPSASRWSHTGSKGCIREARHRLNLPLSSDSANGWSPYRRTQTRLSRSLHADQRPPTNTDNDSKAQALKDHASQVSQIATAVRAFHSRNEPFRIDHGSTNSTRQGSLNRDPRKTVNTSRLNRVLHVDPVTQTALVEPNVPMDALVEATLVPHNLIPPVVMEFPGITAGGGYNGTSGESSSFRHGFFNRSLKSVEMVLADGEVVTCSNSQNADLFHGAAGALGTFGVTTLLEIQLRPAKRFVETTYHPVSSVAEAVETVRRFSEQDSPFDYVDGILFSKDRGAVITGKLTNAVQDGVPVQRFSEPKDPWFYLHVQEKLFGCGPSPSPGKQDPVVEAIPLPEYLFRYDRGGFWVGKPAFDYFKGTVPFNSATRAWLDDFLHTRMLYAALHGSGQAERMIIQDLALPYENAEAFIQFTEEKTGIWPLWLCPLKTSPGGARCLHPHLPPRADSSQEEEGQMLNIGLWGLSPKPHTRENFLEVNLAIEKRLHDLGGMKWLYAQTFAEKEDFWRDFDEEWYLALRKRYRAESLPTVYDKVKRQQKQKTAGAEKSAKDWWPLDGVSGIRRAIRSKQYLVDRNRAWRKWVPRHDQ